MCVHISRYYISVHVHVYIVPHWALAELGVQCSIYISVHVHVYSVPHWALESCVSSLSCDAQVTFWLYPRYLYSSAEWFNCIEPPRTFLNNLSAEKTKYVGVFHMSSGLSDSTELSLRTCSRGTRCVGICTLVRSCSTASHLREPS